jgi:cyanophycin synthetase
MLKVYKARFYRGPNLWFPVSGLLAALEWDGANPDPLRFRATEKDLAEVVALLRQLFPVVSESILVSSLARVLNHAAPLLTLLLELAEVLARDFCPAPRLGRIVGGTSTKPRVFTPCENGELATLALSLSLEALNYLLPPAAGNRNLVHERLSDSYRSIRLRMRRIGLNQSNVALARGAVARGIPYYRLITPGQYLQLGQGRWRKRVMETSTESTGAVARMLSSDKLATATLLRSQGIATSEPRAISSEQDVQQAVKALGFPLVVKPRSAGKGMGVTVNITSQTQLAAAVQDAAQVGHGLIIERHIVGDDHRLLVVGGRFVAAAKRLPAEVCGDGRRSVRELIAELNLDPRRGMRFERLLEQVLIDEEAERYLAAAGLEPDSVPADGQRLRLRSAGNLSRGGTAVDVTEQVHPDNRRMAERVAQLVGLDVAGIDFLTTDVGRSWRSTTCAILEVNSTPGLRPHLSANPQREVVAPIIDHLFPKGTDGRVPTAGITGSVGKTTTCRMVAAILSECHRHVAVSTTVGAWIGDELIRAGDVAGGGMAARLLVDPRVEAAVFEFARGGLVKVGMGLDAVDVGAVLSIHDNHVGLNGVDSREQLARVKRIVAVNARNAAVLNADEPLCLAMRDHVVARRLYLVSEVPDNPAVVAHRQAGGLVAFLEGAGAGNELAVYEGERCILRLPSAEIPATWQGSYRPAAINALFAAAIAHGMGVPSRLISAGLKGFQSTLEANPGRMNLYRDLPYELLLTEADGAVPMKALAEFVADRGISGEKRLLLCAAGDRPDAFIQSMAVAVAGAFSLYVCTDYYQLRGRAPGAVATLLGQSLMQAGVPEGQIRIVPSPDDALRVVSDSAAEHDLVVFNTNGRHVLGTLRALGLSRKRSQA